MKTRTLRNGEKLDMVSIYIDAFYEDDCNTASRYEPHARLNGLATVRPGLIFRLVFSHPFVIVPYRSSSSLSIGLCYD